MASKHSTRINTNGAQLGISAVDRQATKACPPTLARGGLQAIVNAAHERNRFEWRRLPDLACVSGQAPRRAPGQSSSHGHDRQRRSSSASTRLHTCCIGAANPSINPPERTTRPKRAIHPLSLA